MDTIKNLFQGSIMGAIIGAVMLMFVFCLKTGYDNFEAVRYTIDAIGNLMLHNPFA